MLQSKEFTTIRYFLQMGGSHSDTNIAVTGN